MITYQGFLSKKKKKKQEPPTKIFYVKFGDTAV